jgi:hypothetical protein
MARSRIHASLLAAAAIAVGVLVGAILVIPGSLVPPGHSGGISSTLVIGNSTGTLNASFFGVDVHVVGNGSISLQSQSIGTPFVSFRFTPQGEATDQIHSVVYNQSGVGSPVYDESDSAFISGCKALDCAATMMVPAEIDNPAEAAATVLYVEKNLSFHPEYWAIGNEPQQWTHWGIPWSQWRPSDHSSPTPMAYALEVQQYVIAMRAADPMAKLIGIESVVGGTTDAAWFRDLVQVDGPNISAVAYHAYPGGNGSVPGSLANFYGSLSNPVSFPLNYPATVALVRQACPSCRIPVFVDEFNSALGGNYSGLMTTFPEVPFTAAALSVAIQENVPRTLFFDLEDLDGLMPYGLLTLGAPPRPAFSLFTGILDHLLTGTVLNVTAPGAPNGVTMVLTENATSASLLLANTNLSIGLTFAIPSGADKLSGPGISYSWDSNAPGPIAGPPIDDPAGVEWNLLPQSVLLIVWDR